jgi:steroid delta-isomerase
MRLFLTLCLVLSAGAAAAQTRPTPEQDRETLRRAIERSAASFNAADPDAIIAPYAPDVVLSYPGVPDMGYAALQEAYRNIRRRPAGVTEQTRPHIDEILVSGDLAVLRLRWRTVNRSPEGERVRHLRDLQVWRREADGQWRFARGMHYRLTPDQVTAEGLQ